jgi:uncharacterized BrkB/YihY/UPF0761 family membrane protein
MKKRRFAALLAVAGLALPYAVAAISIRFSMETITSMDASKLGVLDDWDMRTSRITFFALAAGIVMCLPFLARWVVPDRVRWLRLLVAGSAVFIQLFCVFIVRSFIYLTSGGVWGG